MWSSSRPRHALPRRRWLSQLLLVLYIAAVHGLPALHLGWHKNDHVHALSGLRWLTPRLPAHAHASATAHDAAAPVVTSEAPAQNRQPQLKASSERSGFGPLPHLALGPAHGQQSLLATAVPDTIAGVAAARAVSLAPSVPCARDFVAAPRARAPPSSV